MGVFHFCSFDHHSFQLHEQRTCGVLGTQTHDMALYSGVYGEPGFMAISFKQSNLQFYHVEVKKVKC